MTAALALPRAMEPLDLASPELPGLGPLALLVADPSVTDVLVNGPAEVWVDRGTGLQPVPGARFADTEELRRFAVRLAAACGRRLDDASPSVDAHLPDGTRVHAVLPPVAVRGPYVSLRTLRRQSLGLAALIRLGHADPAYGEHRRMRSYAPGWPMLWRRDWLGKTRCWGPFVLVR